MDYVARNQEVMIKFLIWTDLLLYAINVILIGMILVKKSYPQISDIGYLQNLTLGLLLGNYEKHPCRGSWLNKDQKESEIFSYEWQKRGSTYKES